MCPLFLLTVIVKPTTRFAPIPTGFNVFDEKRTGPILGIAQAVIEDI
jgi:hypothetical protein